MGVLFTNTTVATYGSTYTTEIHEQGGSDTNYDFDMVPELTVEFLGDKQYVFDNIITSNTRCNMILNTPETLAFFNTFVTSEEGTYYLKILKSGFTLFIGKIITDNITLDDMPSPVFRFTAIDTITDLKNIPYEPPYSQFPSVREIYSYIFNQLPIAWLYVPFSPIIGFQSDIVPNVASYAGNLFDITYLYNYFYRIENKEQVPLSCYEVLDELLKRMNCGYRIIYGVNWVYGLEGIHSTRLTNLHYYDVDGVYITSTTPSVDSVTLDDDALAEGKYTFNSGYKRFTIEADKVFSNRGFGSGIFWTLLFPTPGAVEFKAIGLAKNGLTYKLRINHRIQSITRTDPLLGINEFLYIRVSCKEIKVSDGTETAIFTDDDYLVPTIIGDYFFELTLSTQSYDRVIWCSVTTAEFEPTVNIDVITVISNINLTETAQTYDKIKVISTIDGSGNPNDKILNIYGNHNNGTDLVRFRYKATSSSDIQDTYEFKMSGGGSWSAYETLITETLLARLGSTQILEISYNDFWFHNVFDIVTYLTVDYFIAGLVHNLLQDTTNFTLIKLNDVQSGITTVEEVPYEIDINNTVSTIIGNFRLLQYTDSYYAEFENVTDDFIETDDLSEYFTDYTADQIKKYWSIYANGNKQQYVDYTLVTDPPAAGELNIYQWTYFTDTFKFYFGMPLEDAYVEIKFAK